MNKLICPECGSENISTWIRDYPFFYGRKGDIQVELTAKDIFVRTCKNCHFSFIDYKSEKIIEEEFS